MAGHDTEKDFSDAIAACRDIFIKKLNDYGPSWRLMRPASVTDQLLIKARRIRTLETAKEAMVDEGIQPEFMAIVNYGIVALIQLRLGDTLSVDLDPQEAAGLYDKLMKQTTDLMLAKNHDYDEAWRQMRVSSFTDIILTKLQRVKQIESNEGKTLVSEGVDSNYMDIVNYSLFAIIKLSHGE